MFYQKSLDLQIVIYPFQRAYQHFHLHLCTVFCKAVFNAFFHIVGEIGHFLCESERSFDQAELDQCIFLTVPDICEVDTVNTVINFNKQFLQADRGMKFWQGAPIRI